MPRGDWSDRIKVTDNAQDFILRQIAEYDASISFVSELPFARALLETQEMFTKGGYYITPIHLLRKISSYKVKSDFPFTDRINEMIHRIRSAGLLPENQALYNAFVKFFVQFNLKKIKRSDNIDEEFPLPMVVAYGWIASGIVFCIEIIWEKFNLSAKILMVTQALRKIFFRKCRSCHRVCTEWFGKFRIRQRIQLLLARKSKQRPFLK